MLISNKHFYYLTPNRNKLKLQLWTSPFLTYLNNTVVSILTIDFKRRCRSYKYLWTLISYKYTLKFDIFTIHN